MHTNPQAESSLQARLARARAYHERTKHHPHQFARSLGFMDWSTQPDPFRRYEGAPLLPLARPDCAPVPTFADLTAGRWPACEALNAMAVSRLFYFSLALSAWKQVAGAPPWSLRVNPSSGDLHPTEAYLIAGPVEGLSDSAAIYHYAPRVHGLELRRGLTDSEWHTLSAGLPGHGILVGIASIYWRESWKYGERAFRYCHHDAGHAIAAIAYSAATLGWETRLIPGISHRQLAAMLGIAGQHGPEAEHPDCLLALFPAAGSEPRSASPPRCADLPAGLGDERHWLGTPNVLSREHHSWPVIEEVAEATRHAVDASPPVGFPHRAGAAVSVNGRDMGGAGRSEPAQAIIRRRRSAVAMDARTDIGRETFYHMLRRTLPGASPLPFAALPWAAQVSLAVFVHRVRDLPAGLYVLSRGAGHEQALQESLDAEFAWRTPPSCPGDLDFFMLVQGDAREAARFISCQQDIAADGAFSLGMLARVDAALDHWGPAGYPRLFWETGLIGQALYLEAEAAGVRATGIGCFFDDVMHELLGIKDTQWQSLYHFTVGGAVEDPRLQTLDAYYHLAP